MIATARDLAGLSPRRPTQAKLRRAISTAYYAMFHSLACASANLLIGKTRSPMWHQVYRALEHGRAKNACQHFEAMQGFPAEVRHFAKVFVMLQAERHRADYALDGGIYYKSDVLGDIASAELAIRLLDLADVNARRNFVVHVLFRQRP